MTVNWSVFSQQITGVLGYKSNKPHLTSVILLIVDNNYMKKYTVIFCMHKEKYLHIYIKITHLKPYTELTGQTAPSAG